MAGLTAKSSNKWSPEEDKVLLQQVFLLSRQGKANDWALISSALPGRNNKDCRKRWCNHLVGGLRKGQWEPDEDVRLEAGVKEYGGQWALVAEEVGTRSADQCAKRWTHCLNPALDHSKWSDEEEKRLFAAVEKHGRAWKDIQRRYFSDRAANNVKNRYVTLTRYGNDKAPSAVALSEQAASPNICEDNDSTINVLPQSSIDSPPSLSEWGISSPTVSRLAADDSPSSPYNSAAFAHPSDTTLPHDSMSPTVTNQEIHENRTSTTEFGADWFMADSLEDAVIQLHHPQLPTTADFDFQPGSSQDIGSHEMDLTSQINSHIVHEPASVVEPPHGTLSNGSPKSEEFVLTIENPAPGTMVGVMSVLADTKTKFRIELK